MEGLREVENKNGILVGRALVDPGEDLLPVRVFNPGQEPVVVYRDMALATVEPISHLADPVEQEGAQHCRMVGAATEEEEEAVLASLVDGVEEEKKSPVEAIIEGA